MNEVSSQRGGRVFACASNLPCLLAASAVLFVDQLTIQIPPTPITTITSPNAMLVTISGERTIVAAIRVRMQNCF